MRIEHRDVEETSCVDHMRVEVAVCENRRLFGRFIQREYVLEKRDTNKQECLESPNDREESLPAVVAQEADIPEPELYRAVHVRNKLIAPVRDASMDVVRRAVDVFRFLKNEQERNDCDDYIEDAPRDCVEQHSKREPSAHGDRVVEVHEERF